MNESCPTYWMRHVAYECVTSADVSSTSLSFVWCECVMSHMNVSCLIWMSHVPHIDWGMSHVNVTSAGVFLKSLSLMAISLARPQTLVCLCVCVVERENLEERKREREREREGERERHTQKLNAGTSAHTDTGVCIKNSFVSGGGRGGGSVCLSVCLCVCVCVCVCDGIWTDWCLTDWYTHISTHTHAYPHVHMHTRIHKKHTYTFHSLRYTRIHIQSRCRHTHHTYTHAQPVSEKMRVEMSITLEIRSRLIPTK